MACADISTAALGHVGVSSVVPVKARTVTASPASPATGQGTFLGDRRCHPLQTASDVLRPSGKCECVDLRRLQLPLGGWRSVFVCMCVTVSRPRMTAARIVLNKQARDQALMQLMLRVNGHACWLCCERSKGSCPAASVFQNSQGCHGSNLIVGSAPDEIASKLSARPAAVDETLIFFTSVRAGQNKLLLHPLALQPLPYQLISG